MLLPHPLSSFLSSELVAIMKAIGNKNHHQIWEARKPRSKPSSTSNRDEREEFIRAKYISKDFLFVLPLSSKDPAEVDLLSLFTTSLTLSLSHSSC